MSHRQIRDFQDFISVDGDMLTTTSVQVAAVFGKRHADVIRSIRRLAHQMTSQEYERNFAFIQLDADLGWGRTRQDVAYRITRDGFTLLVMGFNGRKAFSFKLAYIRAFNAMAAFVSRQREGVLQRFFQKELEVKNRRSSASAAARELNSWKYEKALLNAELAAIGDKMQTKLLLESPDQNP